MRVSKVVVLLLLLVTHGAAKKPPKEFRDFSQKGANYKPLENLRFFADDISYSGMEQVSIFGKQHPALKYALSAKVEVQTLSATGSVHMEAYERIPADFEVLVVEDKDRGIHDSFIQAMYQLWSKKELFSGEYFFDFSIKNNDYVLSSMPDLVNVKSFYFIWVNGRVIKIAFKGFRNKGKGGWGVMDSFTSDNLRLRVADAEFRAYQYPLRPHKKFIELYERGFFSATGRPNKGMQRTRNQHVSHARLVAGGGLCAPLMPSVVLLLVLQRYKHYVANSRECFAGFGRGVGEPTR